MLLRTVCMRCPVEAWQWLLLRHPTGKSLLPKLDRLERVKATYSLLAAHRPVLVTVHAYRYKAGCRGRSYGFSRVFDGRTSQEDYFDATAGPMVRMVATARKMRAHTLVKGLNSDLCLPCLQVLNMLKKKQAECAMMAYGTSSAGKTYTIEAGLPYYQQKA